MHAASEVRRITVEMKDHLALCRYGIHPKMTGAGGGGSVFAFLKPGERNESIRNLEDSRDSGEKKHIRKHPNYSLQTLPTPCWT